MASGSFGTGMGLTFLSNVHCYGNENSLTECIGVNFGYQSCPQTMDMAVVCAGMVMLLNSIIIIIIINLCVIAYPCVDGEYRLVGNEDHGTNEGRLEVCHNGVWKIVCANEISTAHVQQLCTNMIGPNMQGIIIQCDIWTIIIVLFYSLQVHMDYPVYLPVSLNK